MIAGKHVVLIPDGDQVIVLDKHELENTTKTGTSVEPESQSPIRIPATDLPNWLSKFSSTEITLSVALQSHDCLFARFPLPAEKSRLKHRELSYLAEAYLPLSTEDMVAVFWRLGDEATVIACRFTQISSLLESISQQRFRLTAVTPAVVAGLEGFRRKETATQIRAVSPDGTRDFLRWNSQEALTEWTYGNHSQESPQSIATTTAPLATSEIPQVHVTWEDIQLGFVAESHSALFDQCNLLNDPRLKEHSAYQQASWATTGVLLAVCFAVVCGSLLWRISKLREVQYSLIEQQTQIISGALLELPESRRNKRQLNAKLERLKSWQDAAITLKKPDDADRNLAGILNQTRQSKLQVRKLNTQETTAAVTIRLDEPRSNLADMAAAFALDGWNAEKASAEDESEGEAVIRLFASDDKSNSGGQREE